MALGVMSKEANKATRLGKLAHVQCLNGVSARFKAEGDLAVPPALAKVTLRVARLGQMDQTGNKPAGS